MATRILVSVILVPLFLAVLLVWPPVILTIMVAGIAAIGAFELLRATGLLEKKSLLVCTAVAAAVIPVCYWQGVEGWGVRAVAVCLLCALFATAVLTYGRDGAVSAESVLICLFGGLLIPSFLSALIQLRMMDEGQFLVMLPVVAAFLTDTGAYFVGMLLGKRRGVTLVSPNKSVEGFAGGLAAGVLFMLIYGIILVTAFDLQVNMFRLALYGLVGSVVTILGDLSFSLVKRQFSVKDYGSLLPGHGGMLDRFDSMIFAAPTMWVLVVLFPAL